MTLLVVPCSEADELLLLDAADGAARGRVAVGPHPVHCAAVGGRVFVATMDDRAVSVVADGRASRVETGVLGPSHFAVADDRVLAPCTGGDALAVLDADEPALLDRVGVGPEPHDVALAGDGTDGAERRAFVGSRADGSVSVVDHVAGERTAEHALDGDARVQGVEPAPARAAGAPGVYAVDQTGARVALVTADGVARAAPVGANPYDAAVVAGAVTPAAADGPRVLVPGRDDGTVTDLAPDLSERRVHGVGATPTDVAVADGTAWVTDRDAAVLRALDGRTVGLPHPAFQAVALDGNALALAGYDDDAVSVVDPGARAVRWTADAPGRPFEPLVV